MLSKSYDPKTIEPEIYKIWEKSEMFNPDKLPRLKSGVLRKPFSIVMPPPNITGSLHMGHALNNAIQDILIRFKRMNGYKTLWMPGVDHAGIATQNVVEKELKKEGKTRFEIGREKFIKRAWDWYEKYGTIILDQLKKLGASCDWSRTRFTMDDNYAKAVQKAFIHYYEKGLIYRGERVVNWCPRCATSLSDLELEYKEEKGNLWYIRYPFKSDPNLQIRPNDTNKSEKIIEKNLSYKLNGIFFEIQKEIGRFCREKQYGDSLAQKLKINDLEFKREAPISIADVKSNFADFIIENKILIEIKTSNFITKDDYYQTKRYLEAANLELGLLVNFRQEHLKPKRVLNPKFNQSFGAFGFNSEHSDRYIVVATTRPETMLGDEAVAVSPKDARYKKLVGKKLILPIKNKEIPIIADMLVEAEFGTGAVKVTPAHDFVDYEISIRHNLPITKVIDERGKMRPEAGEDYAGLGILEARKKVVANLEELGLIEKIEDYVHNVAKCYRCGITIEPLPNLQWFVKMDKLAESAIKEVESGDIVFVPQKWEKLYFDWLKNIKDWCISRQIWWGHQLPVYFCKNKLEAISNFQFLISKQNKEENFIVAESKPKKCPICKECEMVQSEDVLDTWFSSALWPFATLGWPEKTDDLKKFYPTDVLSTARDIINLWVARMIYSGMEFMGKKPFKQVYVHATVLTKEGKRMSKSLGTGVDPLGLIEKYGADATRFGLIYQSMGGQDMHFAEEHLVAGKKFCNKIWNAMRFVMSNEPPQTNAETLRGLTRKNKNLTQADEKILTQVKDLKDKVSKYIESFEFGQALHDIYDFFWHDFCDVYIEESKKQMNNEKLKESTQGVLLAVLADSLKISHPFMPFVTEKIYQMLPIEDKPRQKGRDKQLLMVERWE